MRATHLKKRFLFIALSVIFTGLIFSCKGKPKNEKITIEDPSETEIEALNDSILTLAVDTNIHLIQGSAAKGESWESWDDAFSACFKNAAFKKNKIYLGPSNLKYLGTILSKDKQSTRRELVTIVPSADFSQFATRGGRVNECDLTKIKNFSINFFLAAALPQMTDSLAAAVTKYDSVIVTAGEWQIDELKTDDFFDYIDQHLDNPKIAAYKKSLLEKNNLIITKVVKVNGFSAEIYNSKGFSTDASAELKGVGKTLDIATPDSANSQLSFKLNLKSSKKGIVNVSSTGQFYIFAMVQKAKKL